LSIKVQGVFSMELIFLFEVQQDTISDFFNICHKRYLLSYLEMLYKTVTCFSHLMIPVTLEFS